MYKGQFVNLDKLEEYFNNDKNIMFFCILARWKYKVDLDELQFSDKLQYFAIEVFKPINDTTYTISPFCALFKQNFSGTYIFLGFVDTKVLLNNDIFVYFYK